MLRTIEIEHMNVPSCGKFEVEWTLHKIMLDPGRSRTELSAAVAGHFGEPEELADEFVRAADRAYAQLLLRQALRVKPCQPCEGKGGFNDTTIDRTGTWVACSHCLGYGYQVDMHSLYRLAGIRQERR